jgi:excisionase family DNA binding protein
MSAQSKMMEVRVKVLVETIEGSLEELKKVLIDYGERVETLESVSQTNVQLPPTMSAADVSKYLGITRSKVYDLLDRRIIKSAKEGSRRLVFRDDFMEYISRKRA